MKKTGGMKCMSEWLRHWENGEKYSATETEEETWKVLWREAWVASEIIPTIWSKGCPSPDWPLFRWKTWDSKNVYWISHGHTSARTEDQNPSLWIPHPESTYPVENNLRRKNKNWN